jgi:TonB family protein
MDVRRAPVIVGLVLLPVVGWSADPAPPKVAGTDVPAPHAVKIVQPEYPAEAQAKGISGIVIIEIVIDEEGNVASAALLRSIPELDDAALKAVRAWKYEVTRVDGVPVRVRHVVPISFTRRVPAVSRQAGVPELRQGAAPAMPRTVAAVPAQVRAAAQIELAADGTVLGVDDVSGDKPWTDALVAALRTWRFAPGKEGQEISLRVEATFVSAGQGAPRVDLALTGLRVSETHPPATATPVAEPTQSATAETPAAPPALATAAGRAPAGGGTPPATGASAAATNAPAANAPATSAPETEVIGGAAPAPPAPARPPEPGTSAVAGITLGVGLPDLVTGRRPVVPPLARINGVGGEVRVLFRIAASGKCTVQKTDGPDLLRPQAEQAVATWAFRRTTAELLYAEAVFTYTGNEATAAVSLRD